MIMPYTHIEYVRLFMPRVSITRKPRILATCVCRIECLCVLKPCMSLCAYFNTVSRFFFCGFIWRQVKESARAISPYVYIIQLTNRRAKYVHSQSMFITKRWTPIFKPKLVKQQAQRLKSNGCEWIDYYSPYEWSSRVN